MRSARISIRCSTDTPRSHRVAVLGGGVVGLTSALRLVKSDLNLNVSVIAEHIGSGTTSEGAGGLWKPYSLMNTDPYLVNSWGTDTFNHYMDLYNSPQAPKAGVMLTSAYQLWREEHPDPEWASVVPHFRRMTTKELRLYDASGVYTNGWFYTTMITDAKLYLNWLISELKQSGCQFVQKKVSSLAELSEYSAIINCSGVGARELAGDDGVVPIRGQVVRVKASWIKHHVDADHCTYIIPNRDDVVLGGTLGTLEDWDTGVRDWDTKDILERCSQVVPSLAAAEVASVWVGLRPGRTTGLRLEAEKIGEQRVLHNYGHGGSGLTLAWGCAGDIVELMRCDEENLNTPALSYISLTVFMTPSMRSIPKPSLLPCSDMNKSARAPHVCAVSRNTVHSVESAKAGEALLKRHGIRILQRVGSSGSRAVQLDVASVIIEIKEERNQQISRHALLPSELATRIAFLAELGIEAKEVKTYFDRYGSKFLYFSIPKASALVEWCTSIEGGALIPEDMALLLKRYPLFFKQHTVQSMQFKMEALLGILGGMKSTQKRRLLLLHPTVFALSATSLMDRMSRLMELLPAAKNVWADIISPAPGFNSCLLGDQDKGAHVIQWLKSHLDLNDAQIARVLYLRPEILRFDRNTFLEVTYSQLRRLFGSREAAIDAIVRSPPLLAMTETTLLGNIEEMTKHHMSKNDIVLVIHTAPEVFRMNLQGDKVQKKLRYYETVLGLQPHAMLSPTLCRFLKYRLERVDQRLESLEYSNGLHPMEIARSSSLAWIADSDAKFCDRHLRQPLEWYRGRCEIWRDSQRAKCFFSSTHR